MSDTPAPRRIPDADMEPLTPRGPSLDVDDPRDVAADLRDVPVPPTTARTLPAPDAMRDELAELLDDLLPLPGIAEVADGPGLRLLLGQVSDGAVARAYRALRPLLGLPSPA